MTALGASRWSPFVISLAREHGYSSFVETGSHHGRTTAWAAGVFEKVFSIELDPAFLDVARETCAGLENVAFFQGDSGVELKTAASRLSGPAVFWLDAHAGGGFFGPRDICPLLAELQILADPARAADVILIDDARGFLAPPPPPFEAEVWPDVGAVLRAADPRGDRMAVILFDVIAVLPRTLAPVITAFTNHVRPKI